MQDLAKQGIIPIFWPAFSPNLNPIEKIWNWMKDYIKEKYGDVQLLYNQLRTAVQEVWDAISEENLNELIDSIRQRCQDVIDAQGGHIKW